MKFEIGAKNILTNEINHSKAIDDWLSETGSEAYLGSLAAEHQYENKTKKSSSSAAPSGGLTQANAQLIDQIIAERSKNSKFEFFRENTRLKPPDEPVVRKQTITRSRTNSGWFSN